MRVIIRADGHLLLGGGHVMRQLGLAQALLARGYEVDLVTTELDPALEQLVVDRGVRVLRYPACVSSLADARSLRELAVARGAHWLVLDGYEFGAEFVDHVSTGTTRVLVIDDFLNRDRYRGHVLLNQCGPESLARAYVDRGFSGRLLLGPRYAMLRPEFRALRNARPEVPAKATHLLVSMGSADAVKATELALEAVERVQDPALVVEVVVGAANPRGPELRSRFRDPRFVWHEPASDMASLMRRAHLAVGAAGVTSLELSHLGVPALLMVLADNQELLASSTESAGAALNLGWYLRMNPPSLADRIEAVRRDRALRQRMSDAGRARVDGLGVDRVIEVMEEEGRR